MGWTSYRATHYNRGNIDRKAELDERFTQKEQNGYPQLTVLKSTVVGSTYYGAIEIKRNGVRESVFAMVALTSINNKDYYNFSYKDMDETMGPYETKCPVSILKLLTPTDSEYAQNWRQKCEEYADKKKQKLTTSTVPVGTKIKYKLYNGEEKIVVKMAPAYQFKRDWWYSPDTHTYVPARRIPDNFEIIND